MNNLHLTVNTYSDSKLTSSAWPIGKQEPERFAVRFNNKEYMIVLDKDNPYFEIWSINKDRFLSDGTKNPDYGELLELEETLRPDKNLLENFVKG